MLQMASPAFSPGLGHASDTYIRFKERQYLKTEIAIFNGDYIEFMPLKSHRSAQFKKYKKAIKESNQIGQNYDSWVFNRKPVELLIAKMTDDASFWRSFEQDCIETTNDDGGEIKEWVQNNTADLMGQSIESKMQLEGRSLDEWDELKKAVEKAEQEERHHRMVKHRDQYHQSKYIPATYNSDSDEEDSEDDEEGYYHLYDFVDVVPVKCDDEEPIVEEDSVVEEDEDWQVVDFVEAVSDKCIEEDSEDEDDEDWQIHDFIDAISGKISEVDTEEGEVIAKVPASLSNDTPQQENFNIQEHRDLLQQRALTPHQFPDTTIVETNTTLGNSAESTATLASESDALNPDASIPSSQLIEQETNMASTTTKTTKQVLTETEAILTLAQTLFADLSERHDFYYRASTVHMNTVLRAVKPISLGCKCNWAVRPMAMTKKNLEPPPADQPPAIRLTNPAGVTCELIEGFQDLSHRDFEQYSAERDEEQYYMAEAVKKWRDEEETFEEYDRRLVCEEFWDGCQTLDIKRALEEQRIQCDDNLFEDDSDDDDDWDEYTFSRISQSSSIDTSFLDPEYSTTIDPVAEEQTTTTGNEIKDPTALELARINLNEYTVILNKAVAATKEEYIQEAKEEIDAPLLTHQAALEARRRSYLPHLLSISITKLRLRMAEDGLLPDNTGLKYTSNQPTGPGSITFVGPITTFLTAQKAIHDRAFELASQDLAVQIFNKMDFYKGVKLSMGYVTDLWRDVKKGGVFTEESQAARSEQEDVAKDVTVTIGNILIEAEKWA
ncbi:hypothetical protein BKA65DRAFT_545362 [Rhexocercosporidium sp. MPI-PUGE-AT-0058]|nr:hypothetical protein BKA65DRAFT_545362 [Rhexocercosporidium sp. MPI-PUGE-AT-0058]